MKKKKRGEKKIKIWFKAQSNLSNIDFHGKHTSVPARQDNLCCHRLPTAFVAITVSVYNSRVSTFMLTSSAVSAANAAYGCHVIVSFDFGVCYRTVTIITELYYVSEAILKYLGLKLPQEMPCCINHINTLNQGF